MNTYEPLDLSAFNDELAGKTLPILRNPTRGLRVKFLPATGVEFMACVAEILNCETGEVDALFVDYDAALFTWLFVPLVGDDGKIILPYVYELWDRHTETIVKGLRSVSSQRAILGSRPLPSQET